MFGAIFGGGNGRGAHAIQRRDHRGHERGGGGVGVPVCAAEFQTELAEVFAQAGKLDGAVQTNYGLPNVGGGGVGAVIHRSNVWRKRRDVAGGTDVCGGTGGVDFW